MSIGGRSTLSLQRSLWGGVDVLQNFSRGRNRLNVRDDAAAEVLTAELMATDGVTPAHLGPSLPARSNCPKCGFEGRTLEDFGTRRLRGQLHAQSWCRACRASSGR